MTNIERIKVLDALSRVKDPQQPQSIVAANRIQDLRIDGNQVRFVLNLPPLSGEMKSELTFQCMQAIQKMYPEAEVDVHITQLVGNSPTQASVLPQVKHVIAVASGKGGVGKSTVSVHLARALSRKGATVGIMDADLYGPSVPIMLDIVNERPKVVERQGKHMLIPIEVEGMHVISLGNIVEGDKAVVLRGPRLSGIIRQFFMECIWPSLDYLIIDLPPGTGDIQLTLVQTIKLTGAIMVTTPQDVAVSDAIKALNMFLLPNVNVPILGVVENMSWFTPAELPDHKYLIFGQGGGKKLAIAGNTTFLGQIPLIAFAAEKNAMHEKENYNPDAIDKAIFPYMDNISMKLLQQLVYAGNV
jgi:ATP-binding protein involved in chromosome partitioning